MSEHTINHLGDLVKQILDTMGKFMREIMNALNVLKEVPDMLAQIRQDMNSGFDRLIQAQGEMEIYSRMARLRSKTHLITAENEAIEDFERNLKEDIENIDNRYSKINGELEAECKKRIREIDEHLLEIPSKFPNDYITAFNSKILPLLQSLIQDAEISYSERMYVLEMAVEKSRAMILRFKETREEFFRKITNYEIPGDLDEEKEKYLPVWVMEYKDAKTNEKKIETLLPGDMNISNIDQFSSITSNINTNQAFSAVDGVLQDRSKREYVMNACGWKNDGTFKSGLKTDFDAYFKDTFKGKHPNAKKVYLDMIKNSTLQTLN